MRETRPAARLVPASRRPRSPGPLARRGRAARGSGLRRPPAAGAGTPLRLGVPPTAPSPRTPAPFARLVLPALRRPAPVLCHSPRPQPRTVRCAQPARTARRIAARRVARRLPDAGAPTRRVRASPNRGECDLRDSDPQRIRLDASESWD